MSGETLATIGILLATALLVAANGLFVFHEFAYVVLKQADIRRFEASGSRIGRLVGRMARKLDHYIAVDQLGITVTSLAVGWIGQPVIADLMRVPVDAIGLFPGAVGAVSFAIAFALVIGVQMIAGELMPKTIALRQPRTVAPLVALPVEICARVFHPLVVVLNGTGALIVRALGFNPQAEHHGHVLPAEELVAMIQSSARAGVLHADPVALRRALHFSDMTARDLIVPRPDVVALSIDLPVTAVLEIARQRGYTRYPVYRDSIDDIAGMLNVKDLIQIRPDGSAGAVTNWVRLIQPMPVVPEQASIEQVLHRLSSSGQPMMLLVDEFGGTAGILTVTDIAHELIGSGQDIQQTGPGEWAITGETAISTVEAVLDISLGSDDGREADSIGGLIMAELGRIPAVGDRVVVDGAELRVATMQGMRVRQVTLRLPADESEGEGSG
ncbi:MAG TPA: hemolysin family protein [Thermomicrobiales bacterium]|nr:hemolysin family protein [Thermomicrobiales bacterium]